MSGIKRVFRNQNKRNALQSIALPKPIFILSVDLELAWGYILYPEGKALALLRSDPDQGRGAVNFLINVLEKYDIPATWAVVGQLLLGKGQGKGIISPEMPQFKEGWLDWDFYRKVCDSPLYYGVDIIDRILKSSVKHEIGLHSFSHTLFSQCSRDVARAEVEQGLKAVKRFGINPVSFVFPENEIGYVDLLKENGFQIYRGDDLTRGKKNQKLLIRKFNQAIDEVIASPVEPKWMSGIWEIPGSMLFCDSQLPFTLLPRARFGLSRAVRANKVFHIWLHPRNLLSYKRLAKDLERFLALVAQKKYEGKLEVMTMGGLVSYLNQEITEADKGSNI